MMLLLRLYPFIYEQLDLTCLYQMLYTTFCMADLNFRPKLIYINNKSFLKRDHKMVINI